MVFTYEFDAKGTTLVKATGYGEAIIPENCTAIGRYRKVYKTV